MQLRRLIALASLTVAAGLTVWAGCGTVGTDGPTSGATLQDSTSLDVVAQVDVPTPDEDAGEAPLDTQGLEDGIAAVDVVDDVGGAQDIGPDTGHPPLPAGVTGCVFCHTNKEMLVELAPEEAHEEEEGGGG